MKNFIMLSMLLGGLLLVTPAQAERTSTRLTPEKTSDHLYSFDIQVEPQAEKEVKVLEFTVTVKPKEGKTFSLPRLATVCRVFDGEEFIAECDLEPIKGDGEVKYSFRVARKYLAKSQFIFGNTLDGDPDLRLQGAYLWFYLGDFVQEPKP